ncbi:efflux RND transporter periplasmic adaptor subunit [Paracoccus sp. (in: a-proteobacteria)]|uniref:efflux RND transporter periplasmic adaptor subunit n=1 Tax=Paracoccus sp. TaxID=267 RepID=UPI00321FAE50
MTAARSIIRALAAAVALSGAAGPVAAETAGAAVQADLPLVTLATAEHRQIEARVPVSGSLVARQLAEVHANVAGFKITAISAELGDSVKAGDELLRLSDTALAAQLTQAEAEWQRAEAGVHQAENQIASTGAALVQAEAALTRTRSLRDSGNAAQAVLDQVIAAEVAARAAADSAADGLAVARAALAAAEAARAIARLNLSYARVLAPVDGVVIGRNAVLGANSTTGGPPLFTLVAGGEIELAAEVIETAVSQIRPGDTAELEVAGIGPLAGQLRLAPAEVDPATRLGLARIALQQDPRLRPGLFASGWIITDRREALTVPVAAVLADAQGARVQVVRDGRIETRPVRAGLIWRDRREILQGLEVGEQVVARAGAFFRSGDLVRAAP